MRLACLLFAGLVLLFTSCRVSKLPPLSCRVAKLSHLLKRSPYDSMAKYSYLLITLVKDSTADTVKPYRNATGCFYLQHGRIFLVSVYHALSGCPMFNKPKEDEMLRPDSVDVWFRPQGGEYKSIRLSLAAYKGKPCKTSDETEDAAVMDVTESFRDIEINSMEKWTCNPCVSQDRLQPRDTIVCYGFCNVDANQRNYSSSSLPIKPKAHIGAGTDSLCIDSNPVMQKFYYFISPKLHVGDSGAPVFRIKTDGTGKSSIEFIGIQAGNANIFDNSIITKQSLILAKLSQLK